MTAILAGTGTSYIVENFSYTYDTLGNVLTRADANENNLTETFTYDVLNRLTSATVSQNIAPQKSFVDQRSRELHADSRYRRSQHHGVAGESSAT